MLSAVRNTVSQLERDHDVLLDFISPMSHRRSHARSHATQPASSSASDADSEAEKGGRDSECVQIRTRAPFVYLARVFKLLLGGW